MQEIVINVPDNCEVQIVRKEEKKRPVIRTYQDLIDNNIETKGCWLNAISKIEYLPLRCTTSHSRNIATSEKVAKSMLAMAMISQLMPYYGGEITDKEWENVNINKFTIERSCDDIYQIRRDKHQFMYFFLAFHTKEQRDDFLKYNEQLVKDYLMI